MPVGLIAAAILIVNNVRDLETDRRAGKRTLAVRMGRARTRDLYAVVLAVAYLALVPLALGLSAWVLLAVPSVPAGAADDRGRSARAPTGPR